MIHPIDAQWEEYARMAVHPRASEAQRALMRQSFFAGALVAINMVMEAADDDDEDRCAAAITDLSDAIVLRVMPSKRTEN